MMNFYIQRWADNSATLMTSNGQAVWTLASLEAAARVIRWWLNMENKEPDAEDIMDNMIIYPPR